MIVIAFDIGFKNMAWSKVRFLNDLDTNGEIYITEKIEHQIKKTMNVLNFDVYDSVSDNIISMMEIIRNIHQYLLENEMIWKDADIILVEQQMSNGKIFNIKALKISQHVLAYFLMNHGKKIILEYSPNFKSSFFKMKFPKKSLLKKWSVEKTMQFVEDDHVILDLFSIFPKKDDISDCILMAIVYFFQQMKKKNKIVYK
jgi:hypothetical protein